jgi:4-hydroxy-4-methyl-2-oxoglutarate aldolase
VTQPTVVEYAFERPPAELLAHLAVAHCADLANVLGASCVTEPGIHPVWRGARVLGAALTVRLETGDNLGALVAAARGRPGDVMVVDSGGGTTAIIGSLIARTAMAHGLVGLVIDGAVRDVADLEAMRIPVWSRHVCARQSSKNRPAEIGVRVHCGGCVVEPGDVVLADDDGVVFASASRVCASLDAIQRTIDTEQRLEDPGALDRAIGAQLDAIRIELR